MAGFPLLLALLLAIATPAYSSGLNRRDGSVISNCKHDVAVTFDEGPSQWQDEIVDEFDCLGGKATFFVGGNHDSCIYSEDNVQKLRYAYEAGHLIASNSWSNADFSTLTEAQIDVEIKRLDEAVIKILGVKPKVFRAPSSLPEAAASYITTKHGKTVVSFDTDANAGSTADGIYQVYQGLASQGTGHPHLVRSSEAQSITMDAMDLGSIEALTEANIRLVTVADCLDTLPYETIGNYGVRDSSWTCDGSYTPPTSTCTQTYSATASDKTCAIIAAKFGVTAQALQFANEFLNCGDIWAWTPVCIPSVAATNPITCSRTYNTAAGETCQTIAAKFGVTAESLFSANTFVTCNNIWAGTPLCIPPVPPSTSTTSAAPPTGTCASTYNSAAGETCTTIEQKFGLATGAIKQYNSFVTCTDIWAGTPLCIPSGGVKCASQYTAGDNETCITVGDKFGLSATAIYDANTFVGCDNIWKGTPLCIPPGGRACSNTITSWPGATCDTIAGAYGTTSANIKLWNTFVDCSNIWTNSPICVAH